MNTGDETMNRGRKAARRAVEFLLGSTLEAAEEAEKRAEQAEADLEASEEEASKLAARVAELHREVKERDHQIEQLRSDLRCQHEKGAALAKEQQDTSIYGRLVDHIHDVKGKCNLRHAAYTTYITRAAYNTLKEELAREGVRAYWQITKPLAEEEKFMGTVLRIIEANTVHFCTVPVQQMTA